MKSIIIKIVKKEQLWWRVLAQIQEKHGSCNFLNVRIFKRNCRKVIQFNFKIMLDLIGKSGIIKPQLNNI